ncbi:MAG: hypothetical protein ACE5NN_00940 [Candidatus Bathyarchaeia archaeon]
MASMLLVIVVGAPSIFGLLTRTLTLSGVGKVLTVSVGAYWDYTCTDTVTSIDWGSIDPGASKSVVMYLKNEGNTPITLSLNTTDWSPSSAKDFLSLDWDYAGGEIPPEGVIEVTLTLTVSAGVSGITSFAFDIVMTGTG